MAYKERGKINLSYFRAVYKGEETVERGEFRERERERERQKGGVAKCQTNAIIVGKVNGQTAKPTTTTIAATTTTATYWKNNNNNNNEIEENYTKLASIIVLIWVPCCFPAYPFFLHVVAIVVVVDLSLVGQFYFILLCCVVFGFVLFGVVWAQ